LKLSLIRKSEGDPQREIQKLERLKTCISPCKTELIESTNSQKLPDGYLTQLLQLILESQLSMLTEWAIQTQPMEAPFMETTYFPIASILNVELTNLNTDKPINAVV